MKTSVKNFVLTKQDDSTYYLQFSRVGVDAGFSGEFLPPIDYSNNVLVFN